jgi:putative transposase
MPKLEAKEIKLNEHEKRILTEMKNGSHTPLHMKKRSEIIIRASEGESTRSISRAMKMDKGSVREWRNRYALASEELSKTEAETPKKLRGLIEKTISDAPRPGAPCTFTDEQVACIIALACELPENLGLPFSHWSPSSLRKEALNRGIVESISAVHIGRFLKYAGFKAASGKELAES